SWMIRSRFGSACSTVSLSTAGFTGFGGRGFTGSSSFERAIAGLATMPPSDHGPENNVEHAETQDQKPVPPTGRRQQRSSPEEHKSQPPDRNNADGKGASANHSSPVQQQPRPVKHAYYSGWKEDH